MGSFGSTKNIEKEKGLSAEVINIHTIKPLDKDSILHSVKKTQCAVTAEEHMLNGGLGDSIAQLLGSVRPTPIEMIGVNDSFGESGKPDELLEKYGQKPQTLPMLVSDQLKENKHTEGQHQFFNHQAQTTPYANGMEISHAKGMYIYDIHQNKYLDLVAGVSACTLGHGHPQVTKSITNQLEKYAHVMVYGEYVQSPQYQLSKQLIDHLPILAQLYLPSQFWCRGH